MDNLSKFTYINCICCGKKIDLLDKLLGVDEEEIFKKGELWEPDKKMWNNGVVRKMTAGYGSSLDGDFFYLGICDNCIEEGYRNGRLRYKGDYLGSFICKFTESELKKQEEMRNRENNLNGLIP